MCSGFTPDLLLNNFQRKEEAVFFFFWMSSSSEFPEHEFSLPPCLFSLWACVSCPRYSTYMQTHHHTTTVYLRDDMAQPWLRIRCTLNGLCTVPVNIKTCESTLSIASQMFLLFLFLFYHKKYLNCLFEELWVQLNFSLDLQLHSASWDDILWCHTCWKMH